MKEDISRVIKECEICSVNNRKKMGGSEFISTCRPLEKMALDMIDTRAEGKYVLVGVGYYSRAAVARVLVSNGAKDVAETVRIWVDE